MNIILGIISKKKRNSRKRNRKILKHNRLKPRLSRLLRHAATRQRLKLRRWWVICTGIMFMFLLTCSGEGWTIAVRFKIWILSRQIFNLVWIIDYSFEPYTVHTYNSPAIKWYTRCLMLPEKSFCMHFLLIFINNVTFIHHCDCLVINKKPQVNTKKIYPLCVKET